MQFSQYVLTVMILVTAQQSNQAMIIVIILCIVIIAVLVAMFTIYMVKNSKGQFRRLKQ